MEFLVLKDSNGMYQVSRERDGGCDRFQVTFLTEDEAQNFIIKLLIMNGNLPSTVDMNRL